MQAAGRHAAALDTLGLLWGWWLGRRLSESTAGERTSHPVGACLCRNDTPAEEVKQETPAQEQPADGEEAKAGEENKVEEGKCC